MGDLAKVNGDRRDAIAANTVTKFGVNFALENASDSRKWLPANGSIMGRQISAAWNEPISPTKT